ncbi:MAG: S41 family peptidase [Bacteroidota bacterium]|nr:S41 family peptidase [Bacteroidota bacterium]
MSKILIFNILLVLSFNSFSQTFWKIENEYGDEILLTIEVNTVKNTFEAYTRKDALKDIAGTFTYTLAKTAGKLKYPEIVFIEGKTRQVKDSLMLTGTFTYFDKQYPFMAAISGTAFKGNYIDRNKPRRLAGVKMPTSLPIRDYSAIINSAFALTEKNILNRTWLKSDEWLDFRKNINELKPKMTDDYELAASFVWLGKKLPFSSYEINKTRPQGKLSIRKNVAVIRELKSNTALVDVNSMPSTKKEIDSISLIIAKKGYNNLIIDLRGRRSLNPQVANEWINFLSDKAFVAGVFLTRKWFDSNVSIPSVQDYTKLFRSFSDAGLKDGELYKETGRVLNCIPRAKTFKGKVFVLTDSKTSKISEVLAYVLKREKIAVVVGQKTAGASAMVENLMINGEYGLVLPVADFYNCEGKSLNKIGVEPDRIISGEDALSNILKSL